MKILDDIQTNIIDICNNIDELEFHVKHIRNLYNNLYNDFENFKKYINKTNKLLNTQKIKALKVFENIYNYNDFVINLYNVKNWTIKDGTFKERAEILKKYKYWNELQHLFNSQGLTNKNINDDQLVSFFDTMYLMYKAFNKLENEALYKELIIIMEYRIPVPSKPRLDYVLVFRNNVLLLEFGKEDNMANLAKSTHDKLMQINRYKEQLLTVLDDNNIEIKSLSFIYMPETSNENIDKNNENIDLLCKIINSMYNKQKNAFELLSEIE